MQEIQSAHACDERDDGPETVRIDPALQKRLRMIQADCDVRKLIAEFEAALAVGEGY